MEFITWLVIAMAFGWCVLNVFTIMNWLQDAVGYKRTEPPKPVEPVPDKMIRKDRSTQARQHRDWDYAFAALQIKTKGTK